MANKWEWKSNKCWPFIDKTTMQRAAQQTNPIESMSREEFKKFNAYFQDWVKYIQKRVIANSALEKAFKAVTALSSVPHEPGAAETLAKFLNQGKNRELVEKHDPNESQYEIPKTGSMSIIGDVLKRMGKMPASNQAVIFDCVLWLDAFTRVRTLEKLETWPPVAFDEALETKEKEKSRQSVENAAKAYLSEKHHQRGRSKTVSSSSSSSSSSSASAPTTTTTEIKEKQNVQSVQNVVQETEIKEKQLEKAPRPKKSANKARLEEMTAHVDQLLVNPASVSNGSEQAQGLNMDVLATLDKALERSNKDSQEKKNKKKNKKKKTKESEQQKDEKEEPEPTAEELKAARATFAEVNEKGLNSNTDLTDKQKTDFKTIKDVLDKQFHREFFEELDKDVLAEEEVARLRKRNSKKKNKKNKNKDNKNTTSQDDLSSDEEDDDQPLDVESTSSVDEKKQPEEEKKTFKMDLYDSLGDFGVRVYKRVADHIPDELALSYREKLIDLDSYISKSDNQKDNVLLQALSRFFFAYNEKIKKKDISFLKDETLNPLFVELKTATLYKIFADSDAKAIAECKRSRTPAPTTGELDLIVAELRLLAKKTGSAYMSSGRMRPFERVIKQVAPGLKPAVSGGSGSTNNGTTNKSAEVVKQLLGDKKMRKSTAQIMNLFKRGKNRQKAVAGLRLMGGGGGGTS